MADIKGDLQVGKNLNVAVKATINSNDNSQTLVVGGTAKFIDVMVSSSQGSFSLPLSAGVSGQLLISTGPGGRFNWRDRDETLYLTETSANNKFLQIANLEVGGIISSEISGLSVKLSAADRTPTFTTTNLGVGQQISTGVSGNKDFTFRSVEGAGGVQVRTNANSIVVSAPIYNQVSAVSQLTNDLEYITQTSAQTLINGISITETTLGTGETIIAFISGVGNIQQRSIVGTGGIDISSSSTEIIIDTPANPTLLSELTNDQGFVSAAQFAGAGIIQVRTSGSQIIVSAASTQVAVQASALGGGSSVVISTSANETRFRTIIGSGSVQVSAGATTIVVSAPVYNQVSALSQLTNNVGFVSAAQFAGLGIIQVRVSGTSNGRQVIVSAADRTPTFATTNLGAGQQLALTVSANRDFRFRTITGNGVIDVRTSGNSIEVSASDNGKLKAEITQTAHGFSNDQIIYLDSQDSLWKLAIANDATKIGVAVVANTTANTFDALFGGTVSTTGLLPGNYYFTSDVTPGSITVSAPDSLTSFINPMLYAVSNTTAVILPWRPNAINKNTVSNVLTHGFRTIWQPSGSMLAKITNGAQFITREVGASQVLTPLYVFSKSVNQSVQFSIAMPKSWNEGVVNYQILWSKNTGAAGDVVWGVRAMALSDGDAINGTWGTQVLVTDTATANNNETRISTISNDLTIGNSPQENDLVIFEITRISNNGGDTFSEDAELIGMRLLINIDQENDNF